VGLVAAGHIYTWDSVWKKNFQRLWKVGWKNCKFCFIRRITHLLVYESRELMDTFTENYYKLNTCKEKVSPEQGIGFIVLFYLWISSIEYVMDSPFSFNTYSVMENLTGWYVWGSLCKSSPKYSHDINFFWHSLNWLMYTTISFALESTICLHRIHQFCKLTFCSFVTGEVYLFLRNAWRRVTVTRNLVLCVAPIIWPTIRHVTQAVKMWRLSKVWLRYVSCYV